MAESVAEGLVKKKRSSSVVWEHFRLKMTSGGREEKDRPVCTHCNKSVAAKGGNTTNLFTHLRDKHPSVYSTIQLPVSSSKSVEQKQPTLHETVTMCTKYLPTSSQAINLDKAVAYCIAKDMLPLQLVFRHMVTKLNPRYNLPSRRHFTDISIPHLYSHTKNYVVKPKLDIASYYSATTDLWTSASNLPYITFTVHLIDDKWTMCSFCLETVPLMKDHTGEHIAEAMTEVLHNWNLNPSSLVATTTDNGSNMLRAFRVLDWCQISCFGHNLDLAITKSLKEDRIQNAIKRCHALTALFHRSWKKNRDLLEKQKLLDLPEHKLLSDVVTRWGSTFAMIERIIEQQQAINAVLIEDRKNWHLMLSDNEFSILEEVCTVLKPLFVLTDGLSAEKEVTVSALLPIVKHITDTIVSVAPSDSHLVKKMKQVIGDDIASRYDSPKVVSLLDKSSFLDPRFRDKYLNHKETTLSMVSKECLNLILSSDRSMESSTHTSETEVREQPPSKKPRKGLGAILAKISDESDSNSSSIAPEVRVRTEITAYLEFPSMDIEANPLAWWASEETRFPLLSKLALKYLSVCGTSVPSERVFSRSGFIVNDFRCSLSPENVDKLVFLACNLPD